MKKASLAVIAPVLILGACTTTDGMNGSATGDKAPPVPAAVAEIAAPYQDLTTARLRSEDGCYWYVHAGPVETTLIPLRTAQGNPICTRAQPASAGAI